MVIFFRIYILKNILIECGVSELIIIKMMQEFREIKLNKKPSVKTVKKQTIPKRIKVECCNKYIGERFRAGSCYVCSTLIFDYNCHYAHVIPEAKGGITSVDNLRPTCALCNLSCGTKNLNDFKDAFIGNTSVPMEIEIDANLAYPIN